MHKLKFIPPLIAALICCAPASFTKPLTFVTYHATSQYYPTMSANAIFNALPYGGKLILKVEPEVEKIKAKKSLKANNLVAEGDVQFGGTTATKGTLSMHNVKGSAKGLEAVDAHINNLYLYGVKFPQPTKETMQWQELTLANGYTATFLTQSSKGPKGCFVTEVGTKECGLNCYTDDWDQKQFSTDTSPNVTVGHNLQETRSSGEYYDYFIDGLVSFEISDAQYTSMSSIYAINVCQFSYGCEEAAAEQIKKSTPHCLTKEGVFPFCYGSISSLNRDPYLKSYLQNNSGATDKDNGWQDPEQCPWWGNADKDLHTFHSALAQELCEWNILMSPEEPHLGLNDNFTPGDTSIQCNYAVHFYNLSTWNPISVVYPITCKNIKLNYKYYKIECN